MKIYHGKSLRIEAGGYSLAWGFFSLNVSLCRQWPNRDSKTWRHYKLGLCSPVLYDYNAHKYKTKRWVINPWRFGRHTDDLGRRYFYLGPVMAYADGGKPRRGNLTAKTFGFVSFVWSP